MLPKELGQNTLKIRPKRWAAHYFCKVPSRGVAAKAAWTVRLAASLCAVREGDGTKLDNTMILFFSDTGEAARMPFVVVGGRYLSTAGHDLRYANY